MWLDLSTTWVGVLNVVGIPAAHLGLSWAFTRMPGSWFRPSRFPFARCPGESPEVYDRWIRVKSWKDRMPDAAGWFGGFPKAVLRSRDPAYLERFRIETCRGEAAHWAQWVVISGFMVWTPWPWALVLPVYAAASNLPCILLQRRNRLRIGRVLAGRGFGADG
jgi:glycosyl-4,4'-diaponeurosporenoate acyltransferase